MLRVEKLVVRRGSFELRIERLEVSKGEYLVVLGRSGAGKTTLLHALAGFVTPSSGRIVVEGVDVTREPPERRGVVIVPQSYALFPHMTVFDNIAFGLRVRGVPKSVVEREVRVIAERLGIEHLLNRYPHQLSGGEAQRVALARALVTKPRLLLLDEPFSNLDPGVRVEARGFLKKLHRELGFTAIHATHMIVDAVSMATRVLYLDDGKPLFHGAPREFLRTPFARQYIEEFRDLLNAISGI